MRLWIAALLMMLAATTLAAQCPVLAHGLARVPDKVTTTDTSNDNTSDDDDWPELATPAALKRLLPEGAIVRMMQKTHLSPKGETIVVFDFGREKDQAEYMDRPAVPAIWDGGDHLQSFSFGTDGDLPVLCEFLIDGRHNALALATTEGPSFSGIMHRIVIWRNGRYRQVYARMGSQSRLILSHGHIELYESIWGHNEAHQGEHMYRRARWQWDGQRYRRVGGWIKVGRRDPWEIGGTPLATLALRPRHKQAAHR